MNPRQNSNCDCNEVFIGPNLANTRGETVSLRKTGYTPIGDRIRFGRTSTLSEINTTFMRDKSTGTNFSEVIRVMPPQNIGQDTFLENEVGTAIRSVKMKFGKAPFIKAYKRVLNTSKKIDDEWEKYLVEEVRKRSLLEAGED